MRRFRLMTNIHQVEKRAESLAYLCIGPEARSWQAGTNHQRSRQMRSLNNCRQRELLYLNYLKGKQSQREYFYIQFLWRFLAHSLQLSLWGFSGPRNNFHQRRHNHHLSYSNYREPPQDRCRLQQAWGHMQNHYLIRKRQLQIQGLHHLLDRFHLSGTGFQHRM